MLLWGFLGRHKLLWSGLEELRLLLARDAAAVVGAAALGSVCAFLGGAEELTPSHKAGTPPKCILCL